MLPFYYVKSLLMKFLVMLEAFIFPRTSSRVSFRVFLGTVGSFRKELNCELLLAVSEICRPFLIIPDFQHIVLNVFVGPSHGHVWNP